MKEGKLMLCREIIDVIETTYPKSAALSWDNVGLLVGRIDVYKRQVEMNRKILADMAVNDAAGFATLAEVAKSKLA